MTDSTRRQIPETVIEGRRLGRHVNHDLRSLAFPVPETDVVVSKRWTRDTPVLDQGAVGSCTGNATVGVLGSDPFYQSLAAKLAAGLTLDEPEAVSIYSAAEKIDGGVGYPPEDQGSSGLSVAQAAQAAGLISGYQHVLSIAAAHTAIQGGPFIVGSDWYSGFDTPDPNGLVEISGTVRGGHEYECIGYDATTDLWEFVNSWGPGWGVTGHFFYSTATFTALLAAQGDATVFVPIGQPSPTPVPVPTPTPTPTPTPAPGPGCLTLSRPTLPPVQLAPGGPIVPTVTAQWLYNALIKTVGAFLVAFLAVVVGAGANLFTASTLRAAAAAGILAGASVLEALIANVINPTSVSVIHAMGVRVRTGRGPVIVNGQSGQASYRLIVGIVAAVCFLVYTLGGFGALTLTHPNGWLGLGLLALTVTLLA